MGTASTAGSASKTHRDENSKARRQAPRSGGKRWSQQVMRKSDALDLEPGVFALDDPREIARSLSRSAEASRRRKAEPFRSAMSMLTYYINRGGRKLSSERRRRLEAAKDELRKLYGRPTSTAGQDRRATARA